MLDVVRVELHGGLEVLQRGMALSLHYRCEDLVGAVLSKALRLLFSMRTRGELNVQSLRAS